VVAGGSRGLADTGRHVARADLVGVEQHGLIFTRAGSARALNIMASDSAASSATARAVGRLHADNAVSVEAATGADTVADVVVAQAQPESKVLMALMLAEVNACGR
jgi:hypothetical protein